MNKYWISPEGESVVVSGSHEDYMRHNRSRFDFGQREEIRFSKAFARGWIRVRIYADEVTMELSKLDVVSIKNIVGFFEQRKFVPQTLVVISAVGIKQTYKVTVKEVLKGRIGQITQEGC